MDLAESVLAERLYIVPDVTSVAAIGTRAGSRDVDCSEENLRRANGWRLIGRIWIEYGADAPFYRACAAYRVATLLSGEVSGWKGAAWFRAAVGAHRVRQATGQFFYRGTISGYDVSSGIYAANHDWFADARRLVETHTDPPLSTFSRKLPTALDASEVVKSAVLLQFLLERDEDAVGRFALSLREATAEDALREHFGLGPEAFEDAFARWVLETW